MTQSQLNRAVARVTGESVETIQRRGFSVVLMPPLQMPAPSTQSSRRPPTCVRTKAG